MKRLSLLLLTVCGVLATSLVIEAADPVSVTPVLSTGPLFNYEDAPGTPDADDPAIWVDRQRPGRSLIIGTAKDAGLLVYNLSGELVQAIRPPNAPQVLPADTSGRFSWTTSATPMGCTMCCDGDS